MENGWINTGIFLHGLEDFHGIIKYSPSERFAMICINNSLKTSADLRITKIIFWNLLNSKLSRTLIVEEKMNIIYRYWLADDLLTFFCEDLSASHYIQYVYFYNLNDPSFSEPVLINKRVIPFLNINGRITRNAMDASKVTINRQDFLFVKSFEYVLCPFDITEMGPSLPPFKLMNVIASATDGDNTSYKGIPGFLFAYKDTLYYCAYANDHRFCYDRFLQVKLTDFDMKKEEIIISPERSNLFLPKKINKGVYSACSAEGCVIWQDGCIVLLSNKYPITERIIWILNLDKSTIQEIVIKDHKFNYATFYKGFLQLWCTSAGDNRQLLTKFVFLNGYVPRLYELCTINLISYQQCAAIQ